MTDREALAAAVLDACQNTSSMYSYGEPRDDREWSLDVADRLIAAGVRLGEERECPDCDGFGWTAETTADPLPDGEPGEPYQYQRECGSCGGSGRVRLGDEGLREAVETALSVALHEEIDPDCTGEPPYSTTHARAVLLTEMVFRSPAVRAALALSEGLRRCSKCGSTNVYVRYDSFHDADRLDCKCRECGYQWRDKPLDAALLTEGGSR